MHVSKRPLRLYIISCKIYTIPIFLAAAGLVDTLYALFGWPEWNEFRREWNGPFSPSKNFVVWLGQKNGMVHSLNHSILDRQYTTYSRTKQRDSSIPFSSLLPHKINIYKSCPLYPCPAILSELRTLPNLQSSTNMFRFH